MLTLSPQAYNQIITKGFRNFLKTQNLYKLYYHTSALLLPTKKNMLLSIILFVFILFWNVSSFVAGLNLYSKHYILALR